MRRNLIVFSLIAATTTIFVPLGIAIAAQIDIPARKVGEWEIKTERGTAGAVANMTMQLCIDAETDAAMMQTGLSIKAEMCPEMNVTHDGAAIVIDAKCNIGAMKTTSHTVISGDFQSAYTVKVDSNIEGAPKGMPAHSVITQQATWVGDCPSGMRPGDIMLPGGRKMNISTISKMMGGG